MSEPDCIHSYLRLYGGELGERVLSQFPALHQPAVPAWPALSQLKRRPFPAQQLAIMGIAKRWNEARCAGAVAECGTGKTLISLGSVFTHANGRPFTALAMVPPQLVLKWAREVFQTLPGVRVFVIDGCRNGVGSNGFSGVNEVRLRNGTVVRAGLATIGGEDQITVVPPLDAGLITADPKPFVGYSDNTNVLNWLWTHGVAGFYGGSTQVQLGPGPSVDPVHELSLRAALVTGGRVELTEPGESEDIGHDWADPRALSEFGEREPTEPWAWSGPARSVTGRTWGGCIEVVQWILTAGRFPADPAVLEGGVLLLESSEDLIPAREFGWITRSLGERGLLEAVDAVVVARPPTSDFTTRPSADERRAKRYEQRDTAMDVVASYNADAVVVVGPPFGHTRPQWIVPYGGFMTIDGTNRRVFADYS